MILKSNNYKVIGTRPIRHDGMEKVTGKAVYTADVQLPNMSYGAILRSPHAHALIKSMDTTAAENMDGVFGVITGKDFQSGIDKDIEIGEGIANFKYDSMNIMAREKVMYVGHAVAAVSAKDRNTAEEALKKIKITYETLTPVLTVNDAMKTDSTVIQEDFNGVDVNGETSSKNVADYFKFNFGDVEKGFESSDVVIEKKFSMPMVHQGYIEPHTAVCVWGEDGRLTVWTSTQGAFPVRTQTAGILGMPESRVRVMPAEIGGGFGGKTRVYLTPLAALLSKKSNRPVKMVMDRISVFEASGPAPGGDIVIKLGVTKDKKIKSAFADIRLEGGAFGGSAVGASAKCVFGCYDIENTRIDGYDIVVNKPKSAAYRAPGSPQVAYAMEVAVDEICRSQGWDPLEFRKLNAAKEGTRRGDGPKYPKIGNLDVLKAVENSDHWNSEKVSVKGKLVGRGIASGYWMNGGGKSSVTLSINDDGTVTLVEGSADIGGTRPSIAMQAAEILGITAEDMFPRIADTDGVGYTGMTGGSRTTFATGWAAVNAAKNLIVELKNRLSMIWEVDSSEILFEDGNFYSKSDPELSITFKNLAGKLDGTGGPVSAVGAVDLDSSSHGFGTHIVDLQIDPETGKTDVIKYTAVQDVGKAIHPSYVEGQIQGGAAQGIGWALNEEYFLNEEGKMLNSSYLDYRMPTSLDLPMIDTILVENENPEQPFGVRGVGEVPICPPLGAISNAIHDATGIRLSQLPMKPSVILKALRNKK
jgi:CO/xanthine dehydrogenase Mo-binding subunit